jgi:hypothetical protein
VSSETPLLESSKLYSHFSEGTGTTTKEKGGDSDDDDDHKHRRDRCIEAEFDQWYSGWRSGGWMCVCV